MGMPRGGGEIKGDYERVMRTIHIQNLEPHVRDECLLVERQLDDGL